MAYDVLGVANDLLRLGRDENISVDPLKLQKLVYLAHGWHLAFTDQPIIDDQVEAWEYGPVVRRLYKEFKEFKASPINRPAKSPHSSPPPGSDSDQLVRRVWSTYKPYSGIQLSTLTHQPGSAWDIVRNMRE